MEKKLPTYFIEINEDLFESGIDEIALTETPAIELMALRFNKQGDNDKRLFFASDEKRIVAGPAIIAGKEIYRKDPDGKEYNVVFTSEVIERMVEKFNSEQRSIVFNFEHSDRKVRAFVRASWIVEDSEKDKSAYYGFQLPSGSWFIEAKIDEEDWEFVKQMDGVGFSIEGLMAAVLKADKNEKEAAFNAENNKQNKTKKMKKTKLFAKYFSGQRGSVKKFDLATKKFIEVAVQGMDELLIVDEIAEGAAVSVIDADGNSVGAPDGVYEVESEGIFIEVADGVIVAMGPLEDEVEVEDEMPAEEMPAQEESFEDKSEAKEEELEEEEDEKAQLLAKITELEERIEEMQSSLAEKENMQDKEEYKATKGETLNAFRLAFGQAKRTINDRTE